MRKGPKGPFCLVAAPANCGAHYLFPQSSLPPKTVNKDSRDWKML